MRSLRYFSSKAGLRSVGHGANHKILHTLAHPSLAFILVTLLQCTSENLHTLARFAHPSLTFNLVTLLQCTSQNFYTLLPVLHIPALLSTWWPCYSSVYQIISTRSCQFCTPQPRFQPGDPVTVHVRKYLLPIPILTQPSLAFNPVTLSGCTSENLYTLLPFWHSPASPSTWWPCQGARQKISTPSCPFGTAQPCCQPGDLAYREWSIVSMLDFTFLTCKNNYEYVMSM